MTEEDNFIFEYEPSADEADEEAEDLRRISPETWGEDIDWDDAEVDTADEDSFDEEVDDDDDDRPSDDDIFGYEAINDDRQ